MIAKEIVAELSSNEFSDIIKDKKFPLVVVDFYAEWCMPCLMMAPVLEAVAEKNKKARFCKINTEDAEELSAKYSISSIPCIIIFKNGKEIDRVIGAVSEDELESRIKAHLK